MVGSLGARLSGSACSRLNHVSVMRCPCSSASGMGSCGLGLQWPHSRSSSEHLPSWPYGQCLSIPGSASLCGDPGYPPLYPGQLPPSHPAFGRAQDLGNLQLAVVQVGEPQSHQMIESQHRVEKWRSAERDSDLPTTPALSSCHQQFQLVI